MNIDESALRHNLAQIEPEALSRSAVADALTAIVGSLQHTFEGSGAGLMLLDEAQALRYASATDERAAKLESIQTELGYGPCVDSLVRDEVVNTTDLSTDDRWPGLSERTTEIGVCAVLGVPVHVGTIAIGSLNVYLDGVHEWDESEVAAIARFRHVIEHVLALAMLTREQEELVSQLTHALAHRVTIERAIGVLMGRHGVDAVTAFDSMRRQARDERRKVAELAEQTPRGQYAPSDRLGV